MADGNGQRRKDIGMKMIYGVLAILISAFVAITLGVAQQADRTSSDNKTEIAVIKSEVNGNQEIIIQKMDSIQMQQTMIFSNIKENVNEIKKSIERNHP